MVDVSAAVSAASSDPMVDVSAAVSAASSDPMVDVSAAVSAAPSDPIVDVSAAVSAAPSAAQDVLWWTLYKAEALLLGSRLRKWALDEVRLVCCGLGSRAQGEDPNPSPLVYVQQGAGLSIAASLWLMTGGRV
jgi:hypothetical protein